MIPKIIHYCWFGKNEKSGLILSCMESWRKYLPDYEIMEWNEDNFDVESNQYTSQAYKMKKWAFVSDYVRLWALYTYGGVYFDTDVEVLKSFDPFLKNEAFTGYESKDRPVTAVMGAQKGASIYGKLLEYYSDAVFLQDDGTINETTNTVIISNMLSEEGMTANGKETSVSGMVIYPQIYFCPNNFSRIFRIPSKKSYAIHHFDQSWKAVKTEQNTFPARIRRYLLGRMRNTIGTDRTAQIGQMMKKILHRM